MSSIPFKRVIKRHWPELLASLISLVLVLSYCLLLYTHSFNRLYLRSFINFHQFAIGAVFPILFILLLSPHIFRIAKKSIREQLAITLLPAKRYITGQLLHPLCLALLTFTPLIIIINCEDLEYISGSLPLTSDLILLYFLYHIVYLFAALAGLLHLLARLCIAHSIFSLLIPLCYYFVIVLIYYFAPHIYPQMNDLFQMLFNDYETYLNFTPALTLNFTLLFVSIFLTVLNWKRACAVYYRFE